jgi:hypothetical protein
VRQLAGARNLDLLDSARFRALIAVDRSDAFVAVFAAKYHYDFWRPITAIRNGDLDVVKSVMQPAVTVAR